MNTQTTTPASQLALQQPGDVTEPPTPEAAADNAGAASDDAGDGEDGEDGEDGDDGDAGDAGDEGGDASSPPSSSADVIKKTVEAASQAAKPAPAKPKAAKPAVQPRRRRGPPADGAPEARILAIAATSKMSDANGVRIRRGAVVSVPERRVSALLTAAKIRKASSGELEIARRRHGEFEIR